MRVKTTNKHLVVSLTLCPNGLKATLCSDGWLTLIITPTDVHEEPPHKFA